jgi:hypothetical protein
MIETNYDYDTNYHSGSLVEQDAKAFLGVFKSIEEVPERYYLANFRSEIDGEVEWNVYDAEELSGLTFHQRQYVYGKAWREWSSFCEENGVHSALADPQDIEVHLAEQRDSVNKLKTVHDARFRPLFRWYRWMMFHSEYPHRYNPVVMAVLLDGTTYDIWETRFYDRETTPKKFK